MSAFARAMSEARAEKSAKPTQEQIDRSLVEGSGGIYISGNRPPRVQHYGHGDAPSEVPAPPSEIK